MSEDSFFSDDDDDVEYYRDLDSLDPEKPLNFELYEQFGTEAAVQQGQVKSYSVKEHGSAIYAEESSDYCVAVQRLLWVDGYGKRPAEEGSHISDMTLVVLKLTVSSRNPETKVQHVEATLQLKDKKTKGKNEPRVEAWAPFRTLEKWNSSAAQKATTIGQNIGLTGGYSGAEVSASHNRESTISWEQTDFDSGESTEMISEDTGKRNGVRWFVKQNKLQNQGATPELWMSVLFSRSSIQTYGVKFNIDVRAGTVQAIENKTKRFFGVGPGQSSSFTVTPMKTQVCNFEGKEILKCIDLNNLDSLIGPDCSLVVSWGPQAKAPSTVPRQLHHSDKPNTETLETDATGIADDAQPKYEEPSIRSSARSHTWRGKETTQTRLQDPDSTAPSRSPAVDHSSRSDSFRPTASSSQPRPRLGQNTLFPLVAGWPNSDHGIDSARITNLEARLAHAEARIAAQDQIILQLQYAKTAEVEKSA